MRPKSRQRSVVPVPSLFTRQNRRIEATATPRVTIIVTFYNQAQWVDQALDSVVAQTEEGLQLVIADDGSTDGTQDQIDRWRRANGMLGEIAFAPRNAGLPALLNSTIPLLRGRYVMVLNGDDWLEPRRCERQADALDQHPPTVALVYSDLQVVDVDGVPVGETFPPASLGRPEGNLLTNFVRGPVFGMPCVMFRRDLLDQIGPWDERLVADDFDFLLRAAAAGHEFAYVPGADTNYRRYGNSLTGARNAELAESRIEALLKIRGMNRDIDQLIDRRVHDMAIALHALGYDPSVTRRRLRSALVRSPSRRVVRATLESYLRLPSGGLSLAHRRSRRASRTGGTS